jgi:hypothetical protein
LYRMLNFNSGRFLAHRSRMENEDEIGCRIGWK